MNTFQDLWLVVQATLQEWVRTRWADLRFGEIRTAVLVVAILLASAVVMWIGRGLAARRPGRTHVALPALLPIVRRSAAAGARHGAVVLFLLGVPCFAVALADPFTTLTSEDVSYPGRRIAVMIDASSSMMAPFTSVKLKNEGGPTFFTTVAAAEYFMRLRMKGPYRDLMSLIEFGNEAYVITPFTTDYENILLSIKLIGNWNEWQRFPDQGTIIIQAINQGTELFKAFDFLNASGNLMVIFSDGQDSEAMLEGRPLDEILGAARRNNIPVYFIRIAFNRKLGGVLPDELWKWAVERTGGRFYPAADEDTILQAVQEIDRLSAGRIDVREYTAERPKFAGYALLAVALWTAAAALKLGVRWFRTFP